MVLILLIVYTGAIFCVNAVGDTELGDEGIDYFSTLPLSMLTLFNVCIGDEWGAVIRPLCDKFPSMIGFFLAYFFLTTLGVLNLIIGVFVERTMQMAQTIRDQEEEKVNTRREILLNEVAEKIFSAGDSPLTSQEIKDAIDSGCTPELLDTLVEVGLPLGIGVPELHQMFDMEYEGKLSKGKFNEGVHGLIFDNVFQRYCKNSVAIAQVKRMVTDRSQAIEAEVKQLRDDMTEVKMLRADMQLVLEFLKPVAASEEGQVAVGAERL